LDVLLASGGNVNVKTKKGETPLMFAVFRGYPRILTKLLRARADIVIQPYSLSPCVLDRLTRAVKEAVNDNGDSAVHLAAGCANSPECLAILIKNNANINKQVE
jgi:ankyrin repeat protein